MNIEQLDKANRLKEQHEAVIRRLEALARELESAVGPRSTIFETTWPELTDVVESISEVAAALLDKKREKLEKDFAENFEKI